ncbi:hypothetical protein NITHO_5280003 [Nitrolancea hollandica Lb]|uniref:Uncharacterized protein n=1 Tax=Nitrolancea hollandica Lb TaxID=1129897 RepID=I4ELS4_9BACT|nr:hypothetical protein NITHO_5280003 [Nitrolancea hollandica Lb]
MRGRPIGDIEMQLGRLCPLALGTFGDLNGDAY